MATTITRLGNIRSSMRNHWLTNLDRAEVASQEARTVGTRENAVDR